MRRLQWRISYWGFNPCQNDILDDGFGFKTVRPERKKATRTSSYVVCRSYSICENPILDYEALGLSKD